MVDLIVKKSKIHGKGVFANRDFKKGEAVIRYNLKPLTKEEFNNLPDSEKHFISFREGKYWLFNSPERYVNHSCEPNVNPNFEDKCDFAVKDINEGEEIVTDYRKDDVPGLNMKCHCKTKGCKKIITN